MPEGHSSVSISAPPILRSHPGVSPAGRHDHAGLAHDPLPAPSDSGAPRSPSGPLEGPTGDSAAHPGRGDFAVPNFQEEIIWGGLDHPMVVEFAPDGRVFVAEKSGVIKVFSSLTDASPSTYANICDNVHDFWDRGLLGMALDPDFTTTGGCTSRTPTTR